MASAGADLHRRHCDRKRRGATSAEYRRPRDRFRHRAGAYPRLSFTAATDEERERCRPASRLLLPHGSGSACESAPRWAESRVACALPRRDRHRRDHRHRPQPTTAHDLDRRGIDDLTRDRAGARAPMGKQASGRSLAQLPVIVRSERVVLGSETLATMRKRAWRPRSRRFAWKATRRRMSSACRATGSLGDMPRAS